jgi:muramoyltetrapeptide carboxypeptidase
MPSTVECTAVLTMPPPLRPGDIVAVVAPSSPFPLRDMWAGLAWLRARYRLVMSPGALTRDAYLAGSDARRRDELVRAIRHPEARAIVAARGGYGATRIEASIPWHELADRPKWIVGFSDVTALHADAWGAGIACIHGPNVTGLRAPATPRLRAAWMAALERPTHERAWSGLDVLHSGRGDGVLVGGNLAVLHAMAAARRLVIPRGAVLALEDVTERPYRIDRMLTSLRQGGYLDAVSAIVFGEFVECEPGPDGRRVRDVLTERTHGLGIPVLANAPFGHGEVNDAFVLGVRAVVGGAGVRMSG